MFALLGGRRRRSRRRSRVGPVLALLVVIVGVSASHSHPHGPVVRTPASVTDARTGGGAGAVAVAWAETQVGCSYVYGATGPCPAGYDCSGLLMVAWSHAGVSIPRTSEAMWSQLRHVSMSALRRGDLLLYTGSPIDAPPGHVVMYAGGGQIIQAYGTGYPVAVSYGIPPGAWGAVRP